MRSAQLLRVYGGPFGDGHARLAFNIIRAVW